MMPYGDEMEEIEFDEITNPAHYTQSGGIEPMDFIVSNGLDYLEGNIVKYVSRYRFKGGAKDLHKAQEYLRRLIEREEFMSRQGII